MSKKIFVVFGHHNSKTSFNSSIRDRKSRFANMDHSLNWDNTEKSISHYSINCGDSSKLNIPDESVDFVLTDPPYGSNVQYGELCKFWDVWLNGKSPFKSFDPLMKAEAVVHRRTKSNIYSKDFNDYYQLLNNVFTKLWESGDREFVWRLYLWSQVVMQDPIHSTAQIIYRHRPISYLIKN